MTLEEYLNKYDQVTIKRCGELGTTGFTVTSTNGLMATIGHLPTAKENIELALRFLSDKVWLKQKADEEALEKARKAKIRRVIKF